MNAALEEIVARQRRSEAVDEWVRIGDEGALDELMEPGFKHQAWHG